jgi:hypothetical protein
MPRRKLTTCPAELRGAANTLTDTRHPFDGDTPMQLMP